jgi:hypothetical protein
VLQLLPLLPRPPVSPQPAAGAGAVRMLTPACHVCQVPAATAATYHHRQPGSFRSSSRVIMMATTSGAFRLRSCLAYAAQRTSWWLQSDALSLCVATGSNQVLLW